MQKEDDAAFTYDDVHLEPCHQIGSHTQSTWELSYVIRGSGVRTVGDHSEPIRRGELILVPPHVAHCWSFDGIDTDESGKISNISITFTSELIRHLGEAMPEFSEAAERILETKEAIKYNEEVAHSGGNMMESMRNMSPTSRLPIMIGLMMLISRTDAGQKMERGQHLSVSERKLNKIRVYCRCNFMRPITLDNLAAHLGTSKPALCSFIKRHTDTTFTKYVNNLRLVKGAEMLTTRNQTVASIAYEVGFESVPYFNRLFKERYGCSPKEWRENKLNIGKATD